MSVSQFHSPNDLTLFWPKQIPDVFMPIMVLPSLKIFDDSYSRIFSVYVLYTTQNTFHDKPIKYSLRFHVLSMYANPKNISTLIKVSRSAVFWINSFLLTEWLILWKLQPDTGLQPAFLVLEAMAKDH